MDPAELQQRVAAAGGRPADARRAVARDLGFAGWRRLVAYVERRAAHPGAVHAYREDLGYYHDRAHGLLASAGDGTPGAVARFGSHPRTPAGARQVVARDHGLPGWAHLRRHVRRLGRSGEPFHAAYRAIEAHDPDGLAAVLERWPDVARAEGTNGNDLLAMATATCDERTVRLLLAAGADPSHANAHGWTPLHQIAYRDAVHLADDLLRAGARTDAHGRGAGGTPLVAALFWGNRATADVLVAAGGVQPRNLRAAAGAGDLALVDTLAGTPAAGALRGFYRPHSGFPPWTPADDPQEVLDEALSWAARSDRADAVRALIDRGARPDADVYRGTALVWAAAKGARDAIERLLACGATVDAPSTFGGPDHGRDVTALHLADDVATAQLLLDAGADPGRVDGLGYGPPAGWARHNGKPDVAALIEAYAA